MRERDRKRDEIERERDRKRDEIDRKRDKKRDISSLGKGRMPVR